MDETNKNVTLRNYNWVLTKPKDNKYNAQRQGQWTWPQNGANICKCARTPIYYATEFAQVSLLAG